MLFFQEKKNEKEIFVRKKKFYLMSKTIMKIYSIFKFYKILEKDLQLYIIIIKFHFVEIKLFILYF